MGGQRLFRHKVAIQSKTTLSQFLVARQLPVWSHWTYQSRMTVGWKDLCPGRVLVVAGTKWYHLCTCWLEVNMKKKCFLDQIQANVVLSFEKQATKCLEFSFVQVVFCGSSGGVSHRPYENWHSKDVINIDWGVQLFQFSCLQGFRWPAILLRQWPSSWPSQDQQITQWALRVLQFSAKTNGSS